jgi:hypothetical protein
MLLPAVRLDKTNRARGRRRRELKRIFVDKSAQNSVNVSNERLYQKKDADRKPSIFADRGFLKNSAASL